MHESQQVFNQAFLQSEFVEIVFGTVGHYDLNSAWRSAFKRPSSRSGASFRFRI